MRKKVNPSNRNKKMDLRDLSALAKELEAKCAKSEVALHNEVNKYVHTDALASLTLSRAEDYKELFESNPDSFGLIMVTLYGEAFWMGARWREEKQNEETVDKAFDL